MVSQRVEGDGVTPSAERPPGRGPGVLSFAYSRRLFGILAVFVLGALAARAAAVPDGYGSDGRHRPQAPAEEAARAPIAQGKQKCVECHDAQFTAHERDAHVSVQCEACHGVGAEHIAARRAKAPAEQGRMFRKLAQANCLACHRRLAARPKLFPTVDVKEHFAKVGVAVADTPCQSCHDPHQPLFLERPVADARIHPLIHACADCHHDPTVGERPLPAGHVVTFRCGDCHADVVADFETKPHAQKLDCQTCHLFHKDSEFSGRIHKNANPRFCLLCHLERPFKVSEGLPQIAGFEAHRDEMASDDADKVKRCVDCHMVDVIHALRPAGARGVVGPSAVTPAAVPPVGGDPGEAALDGDGAGDGAAPAEGTGDAPPIGDGDGAGDAP